MPWCCRSQRVEVSCLSRLNLAQTSSVICSFALFLNAALLSGSPYMRLSIFCYFWLTTQWESTFELLHGGDTLGMCTFAVSDAMLLAFKVQVEDTAVFQGNNEFFLQVVRVIFGNKWPWKTKLCFYFYLWLLFSACFKCKINRSKCIHFRHRVRADFFFSCSNCFLQSAV